MPRRSLLAVLAFAALVVAGCGGASDSKSSSGTSTPSGGKTLSLVAYSTPQVVYDEVIPAFAKTPAGKGIGFKTSYGASGEQSRAVEAGQPADVVTFSLDPDVKRLVKAGLVDATWNKAPHDGFVSTSVVSLIVRKGNPKGIKSWADLLKPGIKVLTPNPFTSGAAKWNLVAAYGANSQHGKNPQAGIDYVRQLITKHVTIQDKSGREALQNFTSGTGDVLISYENEALTAQKKGKDVDYVIPDDTIKIENPIAVTKKAPAAAKAFITYAESKPAQEVFASWGYRPVDPSVLAENAKKFPTPPSLFTIRDVGGWSKINDQLFDEKAGAIAKIENDAGVSTSKK
jgi:sulfate transport system substrate-binding protein